MSPISAQRPVGLRRARLDRWWRGGLFVVLVLAGLFSTLATSPRMPAEVVLQLQPPAVCPGDELTVSWEAFVLQPNITSLLHTFLQPFPPEAFDPPIDQAPLGTRSGSVSTTASQPAHIQIEATRGMAVAVDTARLSMLVCDRPGLQWPSQDGVGVTALAVDPDSGHLYVALLIDDVQTRLIRLDGSLDLLWQTTVAGRVEALAIAPSGMLAAAGFSEDAFGSTDQPLLSRRALLHVLDADGRLAWQAVWGEDGASHAAFGLAVDEDDLLVVGGSWSEHAPATGFLRRYDPAGDLRWARQLSSDGDVLARSVVVAEGIAHVGGVTGGALAGPKVGSFDAFAVAFDHEGQRLVAYDRQLAGDADAGGLALDAAGHLVLVGAGLTAFLPGGDEAWRYSVTDDERLTAVAATDVGIAVLSELTVTTSLPSGHEISQLDLRLRQLDQDGQVVWTQTLGSLHDEQGGVIARWPTMAAGGVVVGGSTAGSVMAPNAGGVAGFVLMVDGD